MSVGARGLASATGTAGLFHDIALTPLPGNGIATTAAISHDGRYVANASQIAGRQALWILQLAAGSQAQIVPPSGSRYRYSSVLVLPRVPVEP